MKWCFIVILLVNLLVMTLYSAKKPNSVEAYAQEVSPTLLKILPAGWSPPVEPAAHGIGMQGQEDSHQFPSSNTTSPSSVAPKGAISTAAKGDKPQLAQICFEWGKLTKGMAERIKDQLQRQGLNPSQWAETGTVPQQNIAYFIVYIPVSAVSNEKLPELTATLKNRGFDSQRLQDGGELHGAVSLGQFTNEAEAKALIVRAKSAGFKGLKMVLKKPELEVLLILKVFGNTQADQLISLQKQMTPANPIKHISCSWL